MSESDDYILLKWGTIKGYRLSKDDDKKLMSEFFGGNNTNSAMQDMPDARRIDILCRLIDQFEGVVQSDWSGEIYTKATAKQYLIGYELLRRAE